ncbi:hypothetical protein DNTS_008632 [Danionella cerebrum]|uniref:C2H2-type domain-containing protein n=1 Tax=Danionella cerebrum TaxID=2873325 RepID=A0A553R2X5_9TELE|nr:hypothetical protein DNTS_008632 [Danionella translucida]
MAEPRFNNPYFWPPPPSIPGQLDNLVLINKIKEQLMAEKIRPPHLPPSSSTPSQNSLLVSASDGVQNSVSPVKLQQMPGIQSHGTSLPDIALHARPAASSVAGRILGDVNLNLDDKTGIKTRGLWEDWHLRQIIEQPSRANHLSGLSLTSSRTANHNTSETVTPTSPSVPTSSSQTRQVPANLIHELTSMAGMEALKNSTVSMEALKNSAMGMGMGMDALKNTTVGMSMEALKSSAMGMGVGMEALKSSAGLLGPHMKSIGRGRKKIKAENTSGPLLVVPYPILASGADQSPVSITAKEGKTYRCKVCPLTFFSKSDMQIHSKSHTEAKPHKCPHCSKSFANASYLSQHLRIHLGVKPYHCSYCEKCFRQLSHLQQHTRHFMFLVVLCSGSTRVIGRTSVSSLAAKKLSHNSPICKQSHQRSHNKDKPYKCSNCYRAYSDSASLQIHLSAHAIKNAKAFCCSMCGRAYTSETYLMKHMSKHTVVEHLVSSQSPPRAESPSVPVRISLI